LYLSCTALNHDSSFRTLAHSGKEINDPFLKALALREEGNRSGKMTVSLISYEFFKYIYMCAPKLG
jgi:hypothetical protein